MWQINAVAEFLHTYWFVLPSITFVFGYVAGRADG